MEYVWNKDTHTPYKLTGKLSHASKHSPGWISHEFLHKWRALYGLRYPKRDMKVVRVEQLHDRTVVHLQHLLFHVPVWQDYLIIEMSKDGVIQQVSGIIHPNLEKKLFNRPMHPAISLKKAIEKAKAIYNGELSHEPIVEQYYLPTRLGTPLIYVVKLQYHSPDKNTTTYIHSLTGRIIEIDQ